MDDREKQAVYSDFADAVNMAPKELEDWLETDESRGVGMTREGEREAVGHKSGRLIVEIKQKRKVDLDEDDYAHMKKVVGYVHRHRKQGGPADDVAHSRWRRSLMNWGHDPLKNRTTRGASRPKE